jgi:O-antigen ligase
MPKASTPFRAGHARAAAGTTDASAVVLFVVFAYLLMVAPLTGFMSSGSGDTSLAGAVARMSEANWVSRALWPVLAAVAASLVAQNWARIKFPPHIVALLAYFALAGASAVWAFNPMIAFQRFLGQTMLLSAVIFPIMLASRGADVLNSLFLWLAVACVLNFSLILTQAPQISRSGEEFYTGYFTDKNSLGQFGAIVFVACLYSLLHSGFRRALGIVIIVLAFLILVWSKSKTALGMALLSPMLAGLALLIGRKNRVSPLFALLPIPIGYWVVDKVWGNLANRISWYLYGNPTLSDRTYIWDFANLEIARKPLLGWGFQSFWLAGPDAPSITDAPGWVKALMHAHNGYLDSMLELGYVGFAILVIFIATALHAIGRVADRDPGRAWVLLSFALLVLLTNFLETTWARGALWLIWLIVAADTARYWQASAVPSARQRPQTAVRGAARGARAPRAAPAVARAVAGPRSA